MKSQGQIDTIMEAIPENWRTRWCGGEPSAWAAVRAGH